MQPGKHFIRVLRRNKEVEDSPYLFTVKGASTDYHMPGTPCQVNLHQSYYIAQDEINQMTAVLRLPNNRSEPIPHLMEGGEGTIRVQFKPVQSGEHFIVIKKGDKHIQGSPFSVMIGGNVVATRHPSGSSAAHHMGQAFRHSS